MAVSHDPGPDLIRVLIADSNQTRSELLTSALRRQLKFKVASCCAELPDCLHQLEASPADIVLVAHHPAGNGHSPFELLRGLHAIHPQTGLVVLLDSYDRNLVVNAMRSGAHGLFCSACQPFKSLSRCIATVHKGQIWVNTEQLKFVIDALIANPSMHVTNSKGEGLLTTREEQTVSLVAEGGTNREVGGRLGITENTVKKSLLRIYDKLGVSNRVELVLYALAHHEENKSLVS